MTVVVELPLLPQPVDELWHTLLDLGDQLDVPWALIGGQMVLLHAIEHGQIPPQISQDGDVIADIRAVPGALTHVVSGLEHLGFALQSISADGIAHRYTRTAEPRPVVIDVLAPEGLGERADMTTTPPGRTIRCPAALRHSAGPRRSLWCTRDECTIPGRPCWLRSSARRQRQRCPARTVITETSRCSRHTRRGPVRGRRPNDSQGPPTAASGEASSSTTRTRLGRSCPLRSA